MKAPTILLLGATAIGAIAFHPTVASAEVVFSTGSQGTSIRIGDPEPIYQPVIIGQRNPEWRYREEEARLREELRLREEHRLVEQRERERLAERQEQQRLAERRERERLAERRQNEQRMADRNSSHNSNNYQRNNNSFNNNQRDRHDR